MAGMPWAMKLGGGRHKMIHITLSSGEVFQGAVMGIMRRVRNMKAGRNELYHAPKKVHGTGTLRVRWEKWH